MSAAPAYMLAWCFLFACSPCRTDDVLTEEGSTTLVWSHGRMPTVALAAPAPTARSFSFVTLVDGARTVKIADLDPEAARGAALRVEPNGDRFALETATGWRLFYVLDDAAFADPALLETEPTWTDAPSFDARTVEVMASTSGLEWLLDELDPATLASVVREHFAREPGEGGAPSEYLERNQDWWFRALSRLPEDERAASLELLRTAYHDASADDVVLRRARWALPPESLAISAAPGTQRARNEAIDDTERAAALLASPPRVAEQLACELLREGRDPLRVVAAHLASLACLGPFVEQHACETDLDCAWPGEEPHIVLGPDLRDDSIADAVSIALGRRCRAALPLSPVLAAGRARLGYELNVRGELDRHRVLSAACKSTEISFELEGRRLVVDDEARTIREE